MKKFILAVAAVALSVCLCVSVFAENFVPSVEYIELPEVISAFYVKGDVSNTAEVVLSSLSKKSVPARNTLNDEILGEVEAGDEKLAAAYNEIFEAPSLFSVFGTDVLSTKYSYVVSNLFDMYAVGSDAAFENGKDLVVKLDLKLPEDAKVNIATLCEDEWVVLPEEQVVNNEDGTVTITFEELCPIAVIRNTGDAEEVQSPQTNDATLPYAAMAMVVGLAGIAVLALGLKKIKL